jgi:hypothetical protein
MYSSASSGAENLGWAHQVDGHAIAKPDSMWFGLWDNGRNVRGLPYLLQSWWRGATPDQASTRARTGAPSAGTRWTSTPTGSTGLFTGNKREPDSGRSC